MAASPLTPAGGADPVMDLLFSPRAAFIWDHTRHAITWMNRAARSRFGLSPQDLQAALAAGLTRRFAQFLSAAKGEPLARGDIGLKISRHPALGCDMEVIELADGNRGLLLRESDPEQARPRIVRLSVQNEKPPAMAAVKRETAPSCQEKRGKLPLAAPQLSGEELRSFNAIGRRVRRLTQEKLRAGQGRREAPSCARPPSRDISALPAQTAAGLLFSAFDLVLLLDKDLVVVGCEGRPRRLGLRKAGLKGKPAAQILLAAEQGVLNRMLKKLSSQPAQISRDALALSDGGGGATPCRALLGRWPEGNALYFLALLSLALPSRLKKFQFPQLTPGRSIESIPRAVSPPAARPKPFETAAAILKLR